VTGPLDGEEPDYRVSLANERTFLAWIRTSLGLLAGGVAVVSVPSVGHPAVQRALGLVLLVLASVTPVLAYRRWSATERAVRAGQALPAPTLLRLMTVGVLVVAALALVVLIGEAW
jgi:putative membrane protein